MLCPSCGEDRSPIIEGDQSGRFSYTCANPGCHVSLGPVVREQLAPVADAVLAPPVRPPPSPGLADLGGSLVDTIRARVELLDREIAKADSMRTERTMLVRMLRAAERREKTPSKPSNVVPIASGDRPRGAP